MELPQPQTLETNYRSSMVLYGGIDNGLNGGIVFLDEEGNIQFKCVMPIIATVKSKHDYDLSSMIRTIRDRKDKIKIIGLERAQAYPGQGVVSTFSIGRGYGLWEGILHALHVPYIVIPPQTWQSKVLRGTNRGETKQSSIIFAERMAPNEDWRGSPRATKIHDGLTDAFCIAFYTKSMYGKESTFTREDEILAGKSGKI